MLRFIIRCLIVVSLIPLLLFAGKQAALAVYSLPTSINVRMYVLNVNTGAKTSPAVLCTQGSTDYGCASPGYSYQYSTSTPSIDVENDYLLNVVPSA